MEIDKTTAGLLCSAIISDTLLFRSPTCTAVDKAAGLALAQIAGLDIEKYAIDMFSGWKQPERKSDGDIFYQDFQALYGRKFRNRNWTDHILKRSGAEGSEIKNVRIRKKNESSMRSTLMFFMLTNILTESTDLICTGQGGAADHHSVPCGR